MPWLYCKEQLPVSQWPLYQKVYQAIQTRQSSVILPLSGQEAFHFVIKVLDDFPQLYYLAPSFPVTENRQLSQSEVFLSYLYSVAECQKFDAVLNQLVLSLQQKCQSMSPLEKHVYLFDYLIDQTRYEINDRFNQNIATVLVNHVGQCSGISKAYKYLCDKLGLKALVAHGTSNTGVHAWNIVEINHQYYHVDVTFGIGAKGQGHSLPIRMYLLETDSEASKTHHWDEPYPPCLSDDMIKIVKKAEGVIDSLSLFQKRFEQVVLTGKNTFTCTLMIPLEREKMMRLIQGIVADVIRRYGSRPMSVNYTLLGDELTITLQ